MSDYTSIGSINLGTTFGAWYAKTNEMITRLNTLKVGGITGGDGILVRPQTSTQGGYTLDIASTISKNVTFNGNVTINGVLSSSYGVDVSGINVVLPANSGVTVGNIVYLDSTGRLEKALANDECTSEVVGVVIGFTGGNAQVATTGKVSGSSVVANFLGTAGATLQKGVVYFLSGGVSGAGTTLEPDVTSYVSKPMLLGLTGDTGLILPYRGYIGLTAASSSSSATVNATSGVLSLNGITAALWETGVPQTIANLKQTGHLCGVNYFQIIGSTTKLSKILQLNLDSGFDTEYPDQKGGINAIKQYQSVTESTSGQSKKITRNWITNPDDGFLFATSGITADVYKITKIKIIPRRANTITFSLQKEYNLYAGTTLMYSTVDGPIKSQHPLRIELRRNGYAIAGNYITVGSAALQYTSETPSSSIIEQDIHPIRFTPLTGEVFTVGITAGTIYGEENVNGSFPILPNSFGGSRVRCSTYNINNVILGGIGSDASKYMKASNENIFYDNGTYITGTEGYTLESAILGWNAQYGAVSENLYFNPVSVINSISDGQVNVTNIDILLELYKYDTNTKTTTGNVIIVSSKYSIYSHSVEYSGAAVNSTYTIP
jgi:hypothetical protein